MSGSQTSIDETFRAYCGRNQSSLDCRSFQKLCCECNLYDKKQHFTKVQADLIFAQMVPKGLRRMDLADFEKALSEIAARLHTPEEDVRESIAMSIGPVFHATVPEDAPLHDDKSAYPEAKKAKSSSSCEIYQDLSEITGRLQQKLTEAVHVPDLARSVHDDKSSCSRSSCSSGTPEAKKQRAKPRPTLPPQGQRPSQNVARMLHAASSEEHCSEGPLLVRRVTLLSGAPFEVDLKHVANVAQLQQEVAAALGCKDYQITLCTTRGSALQPEVPLEPANENQEHGEVLTIVVSQAQCPCISRYGDAEECLRNKVLKSLAVEGENLKVAFKADEHETEQILDMIFGMFCDRGQTKLNAFSFAKICKDCNLLDKNFSAADADIIFQKVLRESGNSRRMDQCGFQESLRLVAEKKGVAQDAVLSAVADGNGPNMHFTKALSVRFHDDISLYTGTHVHGGPDVGPSAGTGMTFRLGPNAAYASSLRAP